MIHDGQTRVSELLGRVLLFDQALRTLLVQKQRAIPNGVRSNAGFAYSKITMEHGAGISSLFKDSNPTAAFSLVRLQFEAMVRGSWITFAANEAWLQKFAAPVTDNFGAEPNSFPPVPSMLDALRTAESAPPELASSLSALKALAWDSLNSYTHGGLRQMIRALEGYEVELQLWMMRTSASLTYVATQLLAFVVKDPALSHNLHAVRLAFSDCMHSDVTEQRSGAVAS